MTRSIKQLDNQLQALDQKLSNLANSLKLIYQDYIPNFITVVKRQLMVATYQICTQKYPNAFLELSYSQRTNLQEQIKDLARDFPLSWAKSWNDVDNIADNSLLEDLHQQIASQLPGTVSSKQENTSQEAIATTEKSENDPDDTFSMFPEDLISFQVNFDDCLEQCLLELSNLTNKYLQEVGVLPQNIPNQILAIALQAEENTSVVSGAPNLLSVLIEKDNQKKEDINVTPVIAICLRISDLEFHDSNLSINKQKIIKILNQLNGLSEEYQNLQQEYAIAQAEAAWRASWYEEE